jgi:hypothetical protein
MWLFELQPPFFFKFLRVIPSEVKQSRGAPGKIARLATGSLDFAWDARLLGSLLCTGSGVTLAAPA